MKASSLIRDYINQLSTIYDKPEAESITRIVMEDAAGIKNVSFSGVNPELRDENIPMLNEILSRLMKHEPLQYILGEQIFYQLKFKVNPSVLIPRRETEELVDWMIKEHRQHEEYLNILDIGTGSGCIPIALKKNIPSAQLFATDISEEAITLAKENAELSGTEVRFAMSDILSGENPFHQTFDIIVSNPPYITGAEEKNMMKNVTAFEPHLALFVPDNDPLIFYNRILQFAAENLNNEGLLYFEINESFGKEISAMYGEHGFQQIKLRKDMQGKDRLVRGLLTPQWW